MSHEQKGKRNPLSTKLRIVYSYANSLFQKNLKEKEKQQQQKKEEKKDGKEIKYTLPLSPGVFTKSRETLIAKVIWMNFIWSETIFIDVTGIVLGIKKKW